VTVYKSVLGQRYNLGIAVEIPVYVMKAYGRDGGIAPFILNINNG